MESRSHDDPVRVEVQGPILTIEIDRPHLHNALDVPMSDAIGRAVALLDATPELRVGVLTGTPSVFSVGLDLSTFERSGGDPVVAPRFLEFLMSPPTKPLLAAVEGYAIGGGFEMVLACDVVIAGASSCFALPEVRRGLVAGGGGLLRLGQRIPMNEAMAYGLSGNRMNAARAHELGLVHAVVNDGQAFSRATLLARRIADAAPLAVAASKVIMRQSREWPSKAAFERQAPLTDAVMASHDAKEGARAFLERRAPRWTAS